MSLAASMSKFKSEMSEAASRNISQSRPASTAPGRISTPQPGLKRAHDGQPVGAQNNATDRRPPGGGSELMTHVLYARDYLKDKFPAEVSFEDVMAYLSLPTELQNRKNLVKSALQANVRITFVPRTDSASGKDGFRYNPIHPVTNSESLVNYLAQRQSSAGISAKELKDVWADAGPGLDKLEGQHKVLVTRNKKDNTAGKVWADEPTLYAKQDQDFVDFWSQTKLPPSDVEIRMELEKAGITPTSQVKEIRKVEPRKKEKRRVNRASGKTTNAHMRGILKDYSKR